MNTVTVPDPTRSWHRDEEDGASVYTRYVLALGWGVGPDCMPWQLTTATELARARAHVRVWDRLGGVGHLGRWPVWVGEWDAPPPPERAIDHARRHLARHNLDVWVVGGCNAGRRAAHAGTLAYWLAGPHVAVKLATWARPLCTPIDALLEVLGRLTWLRVGYRRRSCDHPQRWAAWSAAWGAGYVYWLPDVTVGEATRWVPGRRRVCFVMGLCLAFVIVVWAMRRRRR